MALTKSATLFTLLFLFAFSGCLRYSFTGTSIPDNVRTIYIPFFPDQSNSGLSDLSDRLNEVLVNRFVNQSRLSLAGSEDNADALIDGTIQNYTNRPFSVGGDEQANLNQIQITVRATFKYADDEDELWTKSFTGSATYDVLNNPVEGEVEAAIAALQQIAGNMFNDAVSSW